MNLVTLSDRTKRIIAAVVVGVLGAAWLAWAQVGSTGIIYGCLSPSGFIRGIDETTGTCRSGDTALAWYTRAGANQAFLGQSAKAANADTLDGIDSTGFATAAHNHDDRYLLLNGKASDAETLDGLDSSEFLRADRLDIPEVTSYDALSAADFSVQYGSVRIDADGYLASADTGRYWGVTAPIHLPHGVRMIGLTLLIEDNARDSQCQYVFQGGEFYLAGCDDAFMTMRIEKIDNQGVRHTIASTCCRAPDVSGIQTMDVLDLAEVIHNGRDAYFLVVNGTSEFDRNTAQYAATPQLRIARGTVRYVVTSLLQ
jgi:hypothetical protein